MPIVRLVLIIENAINMTEQNWPITKYLRLGLKIMRLIQLNYLYETFTFDLVLYLNSVIYCSNCIICTVNYKTFSVC